ncbi:13708_t:CDS:2, partial [Gigaspora rosea]
MPPKRTTVNFHSDDFIADAALTSSSKTRQLILDSVVEVSETKKTTINNLICMFVQADIPLEKGKASVALAVAIKRHNYNFIAILDKYLNNCPR